MAKSLIGEGCESKKCEIPGKARAREDFPTPSHSPFFSRPVFVPSITSHGALIHCPNHRQPIKVLNKIGVTTFLNLYCAPINAIHPIYIERTSNECGASYDLLSRTTDANIWILM